VRKAPGFYVVYLVCVAAAASLVLIPRAPLQLIILGVQVLAGVMLPSAIIFLQLLLNDKELLGEYANKPWNNLVNWTIIIVLFALSLILAAQVAARTSSRRCHDGRIEKENEHGYDDNESCRNERSGQPFLVVHPWTIYRNGRWTRKASAPCG